MFHFDFVNQSTSIQLFFGFLTCSYSYFLLNIILRVALFIHGRIMNLIIFLNYPKTY